MLHLRSDASFEVQANVFHARSGGYRQGAYLQSISHRRTSVPRTVAPLIALLWIHAACARVHVCVRINEPPPGWVHKSPFFFLRLFLSLLQARIVPAALT